METLQLLTRNEMRNITGGGHCDYFCCTDGPGTCYDMAIIMIAEAGSTNETCQTAGLDAGLEDRCGEGEYLAALYFSGPPH